MGDGTWSRVRAALGAHRSTVVLVAAGVAAFAIRLVYIWKVAAGEPIGGDQLYFYYWGGTQLAHGNGFVAISSLLYGYPIQDAQHPPGFLLLVAAWYKLGLHSPNEMRVAQSLLGSVNVVLMGMLVRKLVSTRAGVVAAVIMAVFPTLVVSDSRIMSETLFTTGLLVGIAGTYAFLRRATWKRIALASLGFTIAASARPESILLFPLVVLPAVIAASLPSTRRRIGMVGVAAIAPLLLFGTWTIYNSTRFEKLVVLSNGFGQTIRAGACDSVFSGPNIGLLVSSCSSPKWDDSEFAGPPLTPEMRLRANERTSRALHDLARHGDLPKFELDDVDPPSKPVDQSVINGILTRQALRYTWDNRSKFPLVALAREGRMLGVFRPAQTAGVARYQSGGPLWLTQAGQIAFGLLVIASVPGVREWRRRALPLYPLMGEVAITLFVTAITFGLTRYRVGMEVCLVPLAAAALARIGTGALRGKSLPSEVSEVLGHA